MWVIFICKHVIIYTVCFQKNAIWNCIRICLGDKDATSLIREIDDQVIKLQKGDRSHEGYLYKQANSLYKGWRLFYFVIEDKKTVRTTLFSMSPVFLDSYTFFIFYKYFIFWICSEKKTKKIQKGIRFFWNCVKSKKLGVL